MPEKTGGFLFMYVYILCVWATMQETARRRKKIKTRTPSAVPGVLDRRGSLRQTARFLKRLFFIINLFIGVFFFFFLATSDQITPANT